ncbi:MAG TPA: flagellar hook-basal body complex protein FliE [Candidatus Acidoferrales bacterium]|nr:flagellar hook-basal body complex protein FliE [Candidatus Acidoferrales bacterium]
MRVELLQPDAAPSSSPRADDSAFGKALDGVGKVLAAATRAEDAYASGTGSLQDAVYGRSEADVALSVAAATAQRLAQAVQTVLNLQV